MSERLHVTLNFEAPLIVGDKKLANNYIESKDYIQGSVIRAAFARVILNHCSVYNGKAEDIPGVGKKKNWIYYRAKEGCCTICKYASICKKFGTEVKFSFFYPEGTSVIPLTSMSCKNKPQEHGFIDSLTQKAVCKKCEAINPNNTRVEFTSGLKNAQGEFKITKLTQTKTSINPYTQTAKDGQLYSLTSVVNDRFTGEITGLNENEISLFKTLRVGAYTSTGYGKCNLTFSKEKAKQPTLEQIITFSKAYKIHQQEMALEGQKVVDQDKEYMALLLTADMHLDIKKPTGYLSSKQYKEMWNEYLNLPPQTVHKIYFDTSLYRGYDTSAANGNYRNTSQYHIHKGGVIVLEVTSLKEAYETYKNGIAIGNDTINGYGQCEIYCGEGNLNGR